MYRQEDIIEMWTGKVDTVMILYVSTGLIHFIILRGGREMMIHKQTKACSSWSID